MTKQELMNLINEIDPKNAEYIANDCFILGDVESITRWQTKYSDNENAKEIAEMLIGQLKEKIERYDERHLTPANVEVGQGASVKYYSDWEAGTIVKVTKSTITIQRDKATLDPNFKPEWIAGGFAGHCINQDEQKYTYERDPNGRLFTFRWSNKYGTYGTPDNLRAFKGRREFYDYNF